MALQVDLLRQSFELVVERNPDLTVRFYEILFERYPQLKPMFDPSRRAQQAKMLATALGAVLDHLEDAAWLEAHLSALGTRHVDYGVTHQMYDWVGDSLLITLAEVAGGDWTPHLQEAWSEAYGAIVGLMLRPAAAAE
ncbi:MAG: globin domain-containing protein [Myxococcales bacterium]